MSTMHKALKVTGHRVVTVLFTLKSPKSYVLASHREDPCGQASCAGWEAADTVRRAALMCLPRGVWADAMETTNKRLCHHELQGLLEPWGPAPLRGGRRSLNLVFKFCRSSHSCPIPSGY